MGAVGQDRQRGIKGTSAICPEEIVTVTNSGERDRQTDRDRERPRQTDTETEMIAS